MVFEFIQINVLQFILSLCSYVVACTGTLGKTWSQARCCVRRGLARHNWPDDKVGLPGRGHGVCISIRGEPLALPFRATEREEVRGRCTGACTCTVHVHERPHSWHALGGMAVAVVRLGR